MPPSGGPAEPTAIIVGRPRKPILAAPVDPIVASVGAGIDPPVWGRAVYWTGSHEPASPSQGTTLIYAHACMYHLCPFTDLHRARRGGSVFLESAKGRFRYRIARIVSLPKVDLATFGFSGYDLALITCELPGEGSEWDNRMVLGVLIGFRPSRS